jgi:hypothetical protein
MRVGCLLGVDAAAAGAHELAELEAAGVSLRLVELDHGPVFENLEAAGHRRQRWLSRSDSVPAAALPVEWRAAAGWLVVPVAGELGPDWERATSTATLGGARVGVGWQGLLRRLDDDGWVKKVEPGPSPLLDAAGLVVVSLDDVGRDDSIEHLRRLAPRAAMVLTAGEGGGIVMHDGLLRRYRAVPTRNAVDPTGAGDVFLAALLTAWLMTGDVATAAGLRFAAATASCAVEGVGLAGVASLAQVIGRLGAG